MLGVSFFKLCPSDIKCKAISLCIGSMLRHQCCDTGWLQVDSFFGTVDGMSRHQHQQCWVTASWFLLFCFWCSTAGVLINFIFALGEVINIDGTLRHQCQKFLKYHFCPRWSSVSFLFHVWPRWCDQLWWHVEANPGWLQIGSFFVSARWSDQCWWYIKVNAGWLQIDILPLCL